MNCTLTLKEDDDKCVYRYVIEVTVQETMDVRHPPRLCEDVVITCGRHAFFFGAGKETLSSMLARLAVSVSQIENNTGRQAA